MSFKTAAAALAAFIRIAVVDTGISKKAGLPLCPSGHQLSSPLVDKVGHGTKVAELIYKNLRPDLKKRACFISVKIFDDFGLFRGFRSEARALYRLASFKPHAANLSYTGSNPDFFEREALRHLLGMGTLITAAAGNRRAFLGPRCRVFPACYFKEIWVVGSEFPHSNWGPAVDVVIKKPIATSWASAIFLGQLLSRQLPQSER